MAFTRKRWTDHTESRIADTANILAQFKDIKMIGLAPSLAKRLQEKQVQESQLALADRRVVVSTFSACNDILCTPLGHVLTAVSCGCGNCHTRPGCCRDDVLDTSFGTNHCIALLYHTCSCHDDLRTIGNISHGLTLLDGSFCCCYARPGVSHAARVGGS